MVKSITGREQCSQPAARPCCRLSDFRPPRLSYLPPPLTKDKPKVEVSVQIAQRWVAALRHRTFFSLTISMLPFASASLRSMTGL